MKIMLRNKKTEFDCSLLFERRWGMRSTLMFRRYIVRNDMIRKYLGKQHLVSTCNKEWTPQKLTLHQKHQHSEHERSQHPNVHRHRTSSVATWLDWSNCIWPILTLEAERVLLAGLQGFRIADDGCVVLGLVERRNLDIGERKVGG